MQGWMIALIVVAGVILLLAIAFVVIAAVSVNKILGRKFKLPKNETAEKYAVDVSWFEEVKDITSVEHITAFDGIKLGAYVYRHTDSDAPIKKVAVIQHGYRATPRSVQPFIKMFYDEGFDVFAPAARGLDISDGKYIGMAWLDRFDILRWIDKVIETYGQDVQIALMGVSMGGATVAAVSGMNPPRQVKCVIDDCGFSSQREEYIDCLKGVHLPKSLALLPFSVGVRLACGYSVREADIAGLIKNSTLPTLFIHGEKDAFVPAEHGKRLYEACGAADKRLELFDAIHAASYASDKERYKKIFTEFVTQYVK